MCGDITRDFSRKANRSAPVVREGSLAASGVSESYQGSAMVLPIVLPVFSYRYRSKDKSSWVSIRVERRQSWDDCPSMSGIKATPKETVEALLERSKRPRRAVPIRNTLVQNKDSRWRSTGPGPLAVFVAGGDSTGLDLNLLVRAVASGDDEEDGYSVRQAAGVWARALAHCGSEISIPAVSKAWTRLEQRKQVKKRRSRRLASITVLREDGSGNPYTHPAGDIEAGLAPRGAYVYFQLPFEYWLNDWSLKLSLPAKTMLLVSLSQGRDFSLPVERAPEYYGFSADTAQRGFRELVGVGILRRWREQKVAPLTPEGYTLENHYALLPPFARRPGETASKGQGDT